MVVKYSPGDVIVAACEPFVQALKARFKGEGCDWCFKRIRYGECWNLMRCAKCRTMFYCNKECQVKDWGAGHKWECRYFKIPQFEGIFEAERKQTRPEWSRIFMRTALKLRKDPEQGGMPFALNGQSVTFDGLISRPEDSDLASLTKEVKALKFAFESIFSETLLSLEALIEIRLKLETFCLNINNPNGLFFMGLGLYLGTALFPQDLTPNAETSFKGNLLEVCALKQIKEGEPVTLNTSDPLKGMNFTEFIFH